jgi:SAM-dependent MidA family methyltransferase
MPSLPAPDPDALAHSARVSAHIRAEIAHHGGWIPFARFMELALYAPGLGYYVAGATKFGASGDFVTAPELGSLFARSLARCVADTLAQTGGDVLELGAGSGRLAADLLTTLDALDCLPRTYFILEPSPDLAQRQRLTLDRMAPGLATRVRWLAALPEEITGVVLANEVLDALPVHILTRREGHLWERGVIQSEDGFAWGERTVTRPDLLTAAAAISVGDGYLMEINPAAGALVRSLAARLAQGLLLFVDYGFGEAEFYHPQRHAGTLMCHYRHHAHADPFWYPGLQDITAHVNFSAVARAGVSAGLELIGYVSQAAFLIDCGITDLLASAPLRDSRRYASLAAEANRLLSPAEMGELFKVMALGRGLLRLPRGFTAVDWRHRL